MRMGRNDQMERSIFDQTGPTGKSGPPFEVDFFDTSPVGSNRSIRILTGSLKILVEWIAPQALSEF